MPDLGRLLLAGAIAAPARTRRQRLGLRRLLDVIVNTVRRRKQ